MRADPEKVKAIFLAAVEKHSAEQWTEYLDRACGDDLELRRRVEELLAAHEGEDSLLDREVVGRQARAPTVDYHSVTEAPGTVIDRYKLLEQIGEGGFGVVFMAEQEEPVRRRVALKIIKPGMDTKEVIARFEAEQQALAMMDHPNIAKVLDAGTTDSGRPYFVMELVRGVPVTDFCDQGSLTTAERLQLFLSICQAVQHAHQKGIIHRDIKPSNVLVTMHDDTPVPKVIDFGVAKATNARLTERTLFTRFAQMVGTPLYMSPEQAQMSGLDVDTRSDIYSLGVLLYELLTGATPFDQTRLQEAAYDELLRIIREEEPPKPSLRISTLGDTLPSVAAHRKLEPKKLSALVRGELDWIVMKALAKDRTRRYGTAAEFAADVTRHLNDEPVLAGPPSVAYRLTKFLRKHRRVVAAAFTLLTLLLTGLTVSLGLYFRAERLRQQADLDRVTIAQTSNELQQAYKDLANEQQETSDAYENLQVEQQRTRDSLENERRTAYFNRIALAYNEWQLNNVPRADRLLDECPADLRRWEWNYLKRLSNAEVLTLRRFKEMVRDAVFSPDGALLATIDLDGKVKLWDAVTGEERLTFRRHTQIPSCVAFSPDGTRVVSASAVPEIGGPRGHGFGALLGRMLRMRGSGGGEVLVWDPSTGNVLHTFGTEHRGVRSAVFSPDGTTIATTGDDKSMRLWNAETGEAVWSVPDANPFGRLAFSPNGQHIAVGRLVDETSGEVVIRNTIDGEVAAVLEGHTTAVITVTYSPDGHLLASAAADEVVVWNADKKTQRFRLKVVTGMFGNVVAFSADSRRLAVACMEQKVRMWDAESGRELAPIRGQADWVTSIAFNDRGDRLAATAGNFFPSWFSGERNVGEVKVWDVAHAQDARTFSNHSAAVNAVAFSPKGDVVVSAGEDNAVLAWKVADGTVLKELIGHSKPATCAAVSPDGRLVASGSKDKNVRVWNIATGELKFTLEGHGAGVTSVAFSSDGNLLATADSGNAVRIWNVRTGRPVMTLFGPSRAEAQVAFSPDGKLLVRVCKGSSHTSIVQGAVESSGTIPGEVRVWDARTGERRMILPGIQGSVPALAFSRDGRTLAVANADVVKLFDVETWQVTNELRGEAGEIMGLSFGRHDKRLAAATEKAVKIWDVNSGREVITLDSGARSVEFDPEGRRLATASDNDVRLWDGSPFERAEVVAVPKKPQPVPLAVPEMSKSVQEALQRVTESIAWGDLGRALLWSVEALKRDEDPRREAVHRTRIALLLQNQPKLGAERPDVAQTPAIIKPSKGLYEWVLGPHGQRLAVTMWLVPPTPEEEAEEKRTGRRPLNRYLLQVFDVATGQPLGPQRRSERQFLDDGIAISPDGRRLALLQFRDDGKQTACEIRVYDVESGEAVSPSFEFMQRIGSVLEFSFSRDGCWILMNRDPSNLSNHMLVWDAETGERLELDYPFNVVYFSQDGERLLSGWNQRASGRLNAVAQVWNAKTRKPIGRPLDVRLLDRAVFSLDGETVAVGDGIAVKTFDVATGESVGKPIYVGSSSFHMALDPKGKRLAIGHGRRLQVWDVAAAKPVTGKVSLTANCRAVEFTRDGLFIITANGEYKNASVGIWDAMTGDPVSPPLKCYVGSSKGTHFRLSADGRTLFTYPVTGGSQRPEETQINARLRIWPLQPNETALDELQQFAELVSGRAINNTGKEHTLTLPAYQQRWQALRRTDPDVFASGAPNAPTKLPPIPKPPQPVPPPRTPAYVRLLQAHGVELKPPLLPIVEALTDHSESIREAAICELQTLDFPTEVKVRLMAEALYDRSLTGPAAEALGKMGPEAASVVPQIIEYLNDVRTHDALIWALGRIGPDARDALSVVRQALKNKGPNVRAEAARALVRIAPQDATIIPDLLVNLDDYPQPCEAADTALTKLVLAVPGQAAPYLIDYMKEFANPWGTSEIRARRYVADLLGKLGSKADDAIPVLERSLNRRRTISEDCRAAEAAAYWRVGGDVKLAVAKLISVLNKRSSGSMWGPSNHEQAATALGDIGPEALSAVAPLRKLLESKRPAERLAAARAIWRITGEAGASVAVLTALLNSTDGKVEKPLKARAIAILGEIGPPAKDAIPLIVDAIHQEDAENASRSYQITVLYRDEEDQPADETSLFRTAGVAALKQIDPDTARKVEPAPQEN